LILKIQTVAGFLPYAKSSKPYYELVGIGRAIQLQRKESGRALQCFTAAAAALFSQANRQGPQRWLNDLRQQKALELLTGGQSIKQVAYSLGYKQSSHFTRQFKQFHGLAPSEFLDADFSSGRSEITQVALR